MPSTIVTTVKGTTSNSYVTVAAARTYFDDRLYGLKFREASEDDQTRALIQAASRLNDVHWLGIKSASDQSLAWPRYDVLKRDSAFYWSRGWDIYDPDAVPQFVKDAQCELALAYLEGWQEGADRLTKVSQDGLAYDKEFAQPAGALPARVVRLISPYIQGTRKVRA